MHMYTFCIEDWTKFNSLHLYKAYWVKGGERREKLNVFVECDWKYIGKPISIDL